MPVLTPQVIKRNQGLNQYPPPPGTAPSTSAAPAPQPPQFAPPPPSNNSYGVSGPPSPNIAPPSPGPTPSPYQSTGVKGAPIPGQTVEGSPSSQKVAPKTAIPIGPAAEMLGYQPPPNVAQGGPPAPSGAPAVGGPFADDASYLAHVKGTIDSTISDAQWMAWKKNLDPGCPSNAPFKTERPGPGGSSFSGPDRCVEKPDNCPDGFQVVGRDSGDKIAGCVPAGSAGGTSGGSDFGGGGLGGGGGLAGLGAPGAGGLGGLDAALQKIIMGQLENPTSRYTPENMATLLSGTKATAEDQARAEQDAIREDAAARGVLGAGATGTALSNARISANRTVAGEQQNIARAKIDADYQDRVTALQQAQQYLDQSRDWLYKQQMRGDQRQQFEANLSLAYARLQQDWDQMQAQFGYGLINGGI